MKTVRMPQVGQDIPSARVVQWLKQENDSVEKGEVIVIVESEKAAFEIEAEESGVLLKILHGEDEEVGVFRPLAYIGAPGEPVPEEEEPIGEEPALPPRGAGDEPQAVAPAAVPRRQAAADRVFASPAARRVAREHGLRLDGIPGTGPHQRIIKRDVLNALAVASPVGAQAVAPAVTGIAPEDTVVPFDRRRREIARRLTLSKQTIPHFYLFVDVDMTQACEWRARLNREHQTRITFTDLLIRASALALREFQSMNAHVDPQRIIIKQRVNVGVAVSTDDGLLVPVIPDADQKSLIEIAEISRKHAEAARRGVMDPSVAGSFTTTSLGMHGIRMFLPVINPPECAILAAGAVEKRPVAVNDEIVARDLMTLTLACDHRAVDGVYAARFLNSIRERLEQIDGLVE